MTPSRSLTWLCLCALAAALWPIPLLANDDLERRATWHVPAPTELQDAVSQWLATLELSDEARSQIQVLWDQNESLAGDALLDRLVRTAAIVDPRAKQLQTVMQGTRATWELPDESLFQDASIPAQVRHNLQLAYGVWLTKAQLYNEAHNQLTPLQVEDVADPATLLFYTGAAHYRLREKDPGLTVLGRLLEREETIPVRFATVARLMRADLEAYKPDTLDDVARLMDSIQVRLGHGRAGTRVRTEEDEVIAKLDKMIEELEKRRQQQQQQGQGGGSQNQSSSPMQDSTLPGGGGPGNVDAKKLDGPVDWGNLPPAERQEALQQLGEQFPSHYREVIEEYFRELARKEVGAP